VIRETEIERFLDDWLGNVPMAPADRVVVSVAVRIGREKQRPAPRVAWAIADFAGSTRALGGIAAVLMVALVGYALLRNNPFPGSVPTLAPPTATPVPSPSPRLLGVEVTLVGGMPKGWNVTAGGLLSFSAAVDPGMSVELGTNRSVGAENCDMGPEPGVGLSAASFVNAIAERRGVKASGLGPIEVDGLPGMQVDVELDTSVGPTCGSETFYVPLFGFDNEGFWNHVGVEAEEHLRLIVLDVPDGQNILIVLAAPDAPSFDARLADAMTIVNNLSFDIS
jgi:hypothetical protein